MWSYLVCEIFAIARFFEQVGKGSELVSGDETLLIGDLLWRTDDLAGAFLDDAHEVSGV